MAVLNGEVLAAAMKNLHAVGDDMDSALKDLRSDMGYGLVDEKVAKHLIATQSAVRLLARTLETVLEEIVGG